MKTRRISKHWIKITDAHTLVSRMTQELNRIHVLSPNVANQIAAGEVIERPASVVKELLENALDAGASQISVDVGFGGLNQIKISDNGVGIHEDDLLLAIAAHATSKINQLNDLYAIKSMGFRGEALASIASVSRLTISSKPINQSHAMMLQYEGQNVMLSPCARSQGTTIDVRDIFFNAPVRKKFLKTERGEYQAIESVVKRFALSAPGVALNLYHNGKQTLALPAASCEKTTLVRIQKLLGKTFVDHAIYLDSERAGMRLHGWVSGLDYQRSQHDRQWIYINRRMVKDKLMNHALKQSYEGRLHPGRHPACVLYLTIPTDEVDVNVHPTKHEVRFQQPRLVHDFMTSQITQATIKHQAQDISIKPLESEHASVHAYHGIALSDESDVREPSLSWQAAPRFMPSSALNSKDFLVLNTQFAIVHLFNEPWLMHLEQVQKHYYFEQVMQQKGGLASRPLLVPVSYAFSSAAYFLLESVLPMLSEVGIECSFASDSCLLIRSIPQLFPALDLHAFLHALIHDVMETQQSVCQQTLVETLIANQSFDARQLHQDEKQELLTYMQIHQALLTQWGLKLDLATCRGILNA